MPFAQVQASGEPQYDQLEAHKNIKFRDNFHMQASKANSLYKSVDFDLNYGESGNGYTSDMAAISEPKPVGATEHAEHDSWRLQTGRRMGTFGYHYDAVDVGLRENAEAQTKPASKTIMQMTRGLNRFRDRQFINDILFAPMLQASVVAVEAGNQNYTSVALPAAQLIGIDDWDFYAKAADGNGTKPTGNAAITVPKIRKAVSMLGESEFDGEKITMPLTIADKQWLQTSIEVTNKDYETAVALADGKTNHFKNIYMPTVNKLAIPGYGTIAAEYPVYIGSSVEYKERWLVNPFMERMPTRHKNFQAYYRFGYSGLRNDDKSVIKMMVDHTVAGIL